MSLFVKSKKYQYLNNSGTPLFVYTLASSEKDPKVQASEIADYKLAQGENYREDEKSKEPLFYSTKPVVINQELTLTTKGRYIVTRDLEVQAAAQEQLVAQAEAKLRAAMNLFGLTKEQLLAQMFA